MGLQIVLPVPRAGSTLSSLSFTAGTLKAAQGRSRGCPEGAKECQSNSRQRWGAGMESWNYAGNQGEAAE